MKRKMILIAAFIGASMLLNGQSFDLRTGQGTIGNADPNWTLTLPNGNPGTPWISTGILASGANSYAQNNCGQWLSPYINSSNNITKSSGTYEVFTYRREFTVTNQCFDPTAALNLNWIAADNVLQAVRVNGANVTLPGTVIDFNPAGVVTGNPTVMLGVNNIEIDVYNWSSYTALQVCGSITVGDNAPEQPQELYCCQAPAGEILSWYPVSGAVGYEIDLTWNDPECCSDSEYPTQIRYELTDPMYLVPYTAGCYSWRVRAYDNNGCLSEWSEKMCGCNGEVNDGKESEEESTQKSDFSIIEVSATPNPASNSVTINIRDYTNTSEVNNAVISITNIQGKEVFRSNISINEAKKINVSEFNSGIYLYKIIDLTNSEIIKSDKLIIE